MKKIHVLFLILPFITTSCILNKEGRLLVKRPTNILCSNVNTRSDTNIFRQFATGESIDIQTSADKAVERAKLAISNNLLAYVKAGSKLYFRDVADKKQGEEEKKLYYEYADKLERELTSSTSLLVGGFEISCQETFQRKTDGIYETDVLLQIEKKNFYNITENILKRYSDRNHIDYEEEIFNRKMQGNYQEFEMEYEKQLNNINK